MTTPDGGSVTWRVTSHQWTADALPDGTIAQGWRIGFTTSNNVTGSVFFTAAEANNLDLVRMRIQEAVDGIAARSQLSG
jgi:hypothetical protein